MRCRAGWQYLNGTTQRLLWWSLFLVILVFSCRVSKVDIGALIGGFSQSWPWPGICCRQTFPGGGIS